MTTGSDSLAMTSAPHPSPHRGRVGLGALFFGLCAAPIVWSIQLMANFALASYSCYPHASPRTSLVPGWGWVWPGQLTINLAALVIALAAAAISWRNWNRTRYEHPGQTSHVLEVGEGRTRFLAMIGFMAALGFCLAIVFNTIALFMVPSCAG